MRSFGRVGAWVTGLVIAVASGVGAPGTARATTVLKVDLPEMARTSEWVVRAHVVAVTDVDLRDKGDGLYTDVTLRIVEVYRGANAPQTYVMRLMGGAGADGMALTIPGMPRFAEGEEVVLFLEKTAVGHVPCGLGQGVWRVVRPPVGPAVVRQSTRGLNLMARSDRGALAPTHDDGSALTLARLAANVRAVPVVAAPSSTPGTVSPGVP